MVALAPHEGEGEHGADGLVLAIVARHKAFADGDVESAHLNGEAHGSIHAHTLHALAHEDGRPVVETFNIN